MGNVLTEHFEGGANGANLSTTNTGYTNATTVSSATATFDNSIIGMIGQLCAKLVQTAASGTVSLKTTAFAARNILYQYFCLRLSGALPNGNFYIASVLNGSTIIGRIAINSTGKVFIQDGTTTVATGTYSLVINKWYRFEWDVNGTTSVVRVYLGQWSQTPVDTITATIAGTTFVQSQNGIVASGNSNLMTVHMDEASIDTTTPQTLVPASGSFAMHQ